MLLLDRPIMFLQYRDISSPVNADYAKQDATLSGTPRFQFHLDYQSVCAKGVLWPHRIGKDERHYRDEEGRERGKGDEGGKNTRKEEENQKDREERRRQNVGYLSINHQAYRSGTVISLPSSEG